mgnify:CR=1 FL=1
MIHLNNSQARQFMLLKQGLLGKHIFVEKSGALDYIRQAGCIQFDPVDICGQNAELTLQSRVKRFNKKQLHELLYKDRKLFDYPDKQLSIIPVEDWPYFERFREASRNKLLQHPELQEHIINIRAYIEKNGAVCSGDFKLEGETNWYSAINWSTGGTMARSVLEQMYSSGDLIIHHKKGSRRYYDLAERHIPAEILNAPEPFPDEFSHQKWRVLRRIGAIGLIWDSSSAAWLNIWNLTTETRHKIFNVLIDEGVISKLKVEGLKNDFYFLTKDLRLIEQVLSGSKFEPRCELIAPLDPLMWDKKLIRTIFGFDYGWEIYTPPQKRQYGVYVLPLLYGDKFIGRIEAICNRKVKMLTVNNIWYEKDVRLTKKQRTTVVSRLKKFAVFNDCGLEKSELIDSLEL